MLTIDALNGYGANTQEGLTQCLGSESFYLGLVEMLICDERFEILAAAGVERNAEACKHIAHALAETAASLGMTRLQQRLEQMLLCLYLAGDFAVLDKQLAMIQRERDILRKIQQA